MKRIGIDFHVADGKYQGSRSHVIELFARVIELSPDLEFFLFLDDTDSLRNLSASFRLKNVHLVCMSSANPMKRLFWQLPALAKRYELDILHCQYILPPMLSCAGMVTIHDVLFESHPEYFERMFRLRSRILMRYSACRAAHVFTVSDFSKSEIAGFFGLNAACISVIYNAADPDRFFPGDAGQSIVARRGLLPGRYLLTVGRIEPRKNHSRLLEAYAALGSDTPPLVIVGQIDSRRVNIQKMIDNLSLSDRVVLIDDADDSELPALMRHASMFIYPAIAEGFGMPPLEAMSCGVPVITSNLTSLPEVVGNAGVLVNPLDTTALTRAISVILHDAPLRSRLRQAGIERSQKFSWLESAKLVRERYLAYLKGQQ
ncbi:MAG: glycosyltransferase family 4 protein [Proteobacteria bacterium]|nr:glycosyltransferase family 4 protein [Pseudomonadota bacterium]